MLSYKYTPLVLIFIIFFFDPLVLADDVKDDEKNSTCDVSTLCKGIQFNLLYKVSSIDKLGKCYEKLNQQKMCYGKALWIEDELAFRAYNLRYNFVSLHDTPFGDVLASRSESDFRPGINSITKTSFEANQQSQNITIKEYKSIRKYISIASSIYKEPLLTSFNDYPRFDVKFSAGYEYTGINKLSGTGFPRVGALLYHKSPSIQFYSHALLTSSAERSVELCEDTKKNSCDNINIGDGKKALEIEANFYLPFMSTRRIYVPQVFREIGPIISVSGAKSSDIENFIFTAYTGVRFAFNPEVYNDVRIGLIEDNNTPRLDLRGQMPIFKITDRSRFYVGYNISASLGSQSANDVDIVKFYVSWNIDIASQLQSMNIQSHEHSPELNEDPTIANK